MKNKLLLLLFLATGIAGFAQKDSAQKMKSSGFNVPVDYYKLDNGLKVILSQHKSSPTAIVAAYYNSRFRIEPRDSTGYDDLSEHLVLEGSRNLGKMEFIRVVRQNGGVLDGPARFDFTNYLESVPANELETMVWAE